MSNPWDPYIYMGDPDESSGSWLRPGPSLAIVVNLGSEPLDDSLSLCNSAFNINKKF